MTAPQDDLENPPFSAYDAAKGLNIMHKVYINSLGKFLPGEPVKNSEIDDYLGNQQYQSKNKALVLRQNRIKTRHYALDKNGQSLYSNAEMAAKAIRDAIEHSEISLSQVSFLASSTSLGDVLLPGLAAHIQAELGIGPLEIASLQSVCASSLMAMKNAYLQIKCGEHALAAVSGSEFSSRYLKASVYELTDIYRETGEIPIESDFLRYTLSDGAGAAILENKPNQHGLSLEIKWIDLKSYAHQFDICMVSGRSKDKKYWGDHPNAAICEQRSALVLTQDYFSLKKMIPIWISHGLDTLDRYDYKADDLDYFCSHYSSNSLKLDTLALMQKTAAYVPEEKWFSNLSTRGNTGAASIFIILEELFNSGKLQKGQKVMCHVPESGRCTNALMLLEVV